MNKRRRYKAKARRKAKARYVRPVKFSDLRDQPIFPATFDYDAAIARGWRPTFFTTNVED